MRSGKPPHSTKLPCAGLLLVLVGCYASYQGLDEAQSDAGGDAGDSVPGDASADDAIGGDADRADDAGEDGADDGDEVGPVCRDDDGDGHPALDCGGDDCDDTDPTIYPGAPDACGDGLDTNCDGIDPIGDGPLGPKVLVADVPPTSGNTYTALLWTGREYLFVSRRIGIENISLVRLDTAGKQLGGETTMREFEYAFDIAWSGSRLGAAWSAGNRLDGVFVYFQAFDVRGRALTDAVRISDEGKAVTDGGVHYGPRIVAAGGDFFVVWSESSEVGGAGSTIWLTRVGPDGTRRFEPVLVATYGGSDGAGLEMAWTGTEAAVVRGEPLEGGRFYTTGLRLQRVGWAGEMLGGMQVISDAASYSTQFQVVWTGSEFAAFWNEEEPRGSWELSFSRRDALGAEILRASLTPLDGHFPEQRPVSWADPYFGVLWTERPASGWQLTLRRFDLSGAVHGSALVFPTPAWPGRLDIAWTGSEFGFIWSEQADDSNALQIYFQRAAFCD